MRPRIAVQLYTLRTECEENFIETLEKVSSLGYEGVELAGVYGLSAKELKNELNRLQLEVIGSHIGIDELENDLDKVIQYNKKIGNKYIICPYAKWENEEQLKDFANRFNTISNQLSNAGLHLLYHNHDHEFKTINDAYGLDLLFQLTSQSNMLMELDTHWVKRAGIDVIDYMDQNKAIIKLLHIKDMVEIDGEKTFAPVGEGIMDIPKIIEKSIEISCPWLIVENDQPQPTGLENVTISIRNMKKMMK